MKQIALNFYEALKWLIGYRPKAMPLTNKWIELDKKEQYRIAQAKMWDENHAKEVRPFWHRKLNTTEKNTLKFNVSKDITISESVSKRMDFFNKYYRMKIEKPNLWKHTMSDADYIKCDGSGAKIHRDFIQYYEPSDLHLCNAFIMYAEQEDLDSLDIEGDEDFKKWFIETRNNLINKI